MIRRLSFVLFLTLASALRAAPTAPPELKGASFESTATEMTYRGGASLTYDGGLLLADEIRYNFKTGVAVARGNVSLTRGDQRLLAEEITYNVADRSFTLKNFRLGQAPVYASGTSVAGSVAEIVLSDAVVTFGEPDLFAPTVRANSITYVPKQSINASGARVGLGVVAPLTVPLFEQNLNEPLLTVVRADAGYRRSLGAFIDVGLLAPVYPGLRLGADIGLYTNRGLLAGPAAAYTFNNDETSARGTFHTGYIRDNGPRLFDILRQPVPEDRGFIEWTHRQSFGDRATLIGQLNVWSDSEVVRDFRPRDFFGVETPDSFLEFTQTFDNAVLSVFARAQPNTFHSVQQRLPEVRFDVLPNELVGGVFQRFNGSFAVLREDALLLGPKRETARVDGYYQLTRRITPREWLALRPVAGARLTHYTDTLGGRDNYTRVLGELGLDAELRASGTYAYKNERWGIDGLRHLVTPRLSYRYIPDADKGSAYIPPVDDTPFSTYLQPLGLGDRRDIDTLKPTHTLRLGLDNTLQTRDRTYGSRDLVRLNFAADWRLDPERGQRSFSEIHTELALMPAPWLRFDVYQSFAPQDGNLREFNTGLTLLDADAWSVRLSSHYLDGDIQQYVADLRYRLNEVYQTVARLHYDSRQSRFLEQAYGVQHNLRNRWLLTYLVRLYDGPRRESTAGFTVEAELLNF